MLSHGEFGQRDIFVLKKKKKILDHQNLWNIFSIITISVCIPDFSSEIPKLMNQCETPTRNMLDVCHFYLCKAVGV